MQIYTGGIENVVKAWDLRRNAVIFSMSGHTDTITSMRVSPDSGGDFLLTNAMVSPTTEALVLIPPNNLLDARRLSDHVASLRIVLIQHEEE